MNNRRGFTRLGVALTAAAAVVSGTVVLGTSSATADPASLTLNYQCPFPLIGVQPVKVKIDTDLPKTIPVGAPTPELVIKTVSTVSATATQGLNLVQAKTLEGSAVSDTTVAAPEGTLPVKVPVTIAKTDIPAQGEFQAPADGKAPSLTFSKAGTAKITVNGLQLHLIPRKADGTLTGLGEFDSQCTQDPGQNNELASITITEAGDTEAPTAPGNPRATGTTTNSVSLAWDAASDNKGVTGYDVYNGTTLATSVTGTSATISNLTANTSYTFTVKAKDAAGNVSPASAAVTAKTQPAADTEAPSAPANPRASGTTASSVSLAWDAARDNVAVTGYDVYNGTTLATSVTGTSATISNLTANTSYTFTVKAKDAAGNVSPASAAVTAKTQPAADTEAPSAPANPRASGTTASSVSLAWDAARDNVAVTGYDVYNGTTLATSVTGTSATISNLTANTSYTFTIKAKDAAGNVSAASAPVTARTAPGSGNTIKYGYTAAGSSFIKAANGTANLAGAIDAELDLATGNYTADLTLNPTTGEFKILGFLPATAKIEFEQAGKTTGSLTGGVLTASSKVTVKLPQISVFGFPISQSADCKTATPSDINLTSGPNFDPLAGGKLTGEYTLAALKGCGFLNDIISALTAGPGNTIQITLTPKNAARHLMKPKKR
ncbi:chitodextrinase [Kibdelosporangium banguiense]|uniref:Chitodextrinase n=1 Tax=Kibdelosporangium banguiense TaxID=1365924 RepID=A0ABS4U2Z2_9PSEU|nr:fibronectin type III domain-containing protein [Kibdelosporangium banguiense]MBP2330560.1 chitodextrinase [Kibdelosporangium banguiense]